MLFDLLYTYPVDNHSNSYSITNGKSYILSKDNLEVRETSNGALLQTVIPFDMAVIKDHIVDQVSVLHHSNIVCYSKDGILLGFNADQCFSTFKLNHKVPSNSSMAVWAARPADNFFFISNTSSSHIHVLHGTTPKISPKIRVVGNIPNKSKGSVKSIQPHPQKPIIFVSINGGNVQIYNYSDLRKKLLASAANDFGSNDAITTHENNEEETDETVGDAATGKDSNLTIRAISTLLPQPTDEASSKASSHSTKHFAINVDGSLAAVVWTVLGTGTGAGPDNQTTSLCIYEVRPSTLAARDGSLAPLTPLASFSLPTPWILGPISFHPIEPVVFVLAAGPGPHDHSVLALTLLEPKISVVGQYRLSVMSGLLPDSLMVSMTSATVVVGASTIASVATGGGSLHAKDKLGEGSFRQQHLYFFTLAQSWLSVSGSLKPIVSPLPVPSHAYCEGDKVVCGPKNTHGPLLFAVQGSTQVADVGLRPLRLTLKFFQLRFDHGTAVVASNLGSVPSVVTVAALKKEDPFNSLFPDDPPIFDGIFTPLSMSSGRLSGPWQGGPKEVGLGWTVLLKGSVLAPFGTVADPSSSSGREVCRAPVICLVRNTASSELQYTFGHFLDAALIESGDSGEGGLDLLTVSGDGCTVKVLALSVSGPDAMITRYRCKLSTPLLGLRPALETSSREGGPVLCMWREKGSTSLSIANLNFRGDEQDFLLEVGDRLRLAAHEHVIDSVWQLTSPDSWPSRSRSKIGLLTSHRIMMCVSEPALKKESEASFGQGSARGPHGIGSCRTKVGGASSICWAADALLFSCDRGGVRYLLPRAERAQERASASVMRRTFQLGNISTTRLFSPPEHHASSGTMRLIACLPDRMLYAYIKTGQLALCLRPLLPLEPVVLGLLHTRAHSPQESSTVLDTVLEKLVTAYLPPRPSPGYPNLDQGAFSSAHLTTRLVLALSAANQSTLAAVVAGVCHNPRAGVGSDFPVLRTIPAGLKFIMGVQCGRFEEACVDLLAARPELQEAFLDPETVAGSSALPHPNSPLGIQIRAAARILRARGKYDLSMRLADLAGDDIQLLALFAGQSSGTVHPALTHLLEASKLPTAVSVLGNLLTSRELPSGGSVYQNAVNVGALGGSGRRNGLLRGVALNGVDFGGVPVSGPEAADLSKFEREHRQIMTTRGGGLGPPLCPTMGLRLGALAADTVEDWLGRSTLGGLEDEDAGSAGKRVLPAFESPASRPAGWVEGVGEGKDWDRVVGYWRFSDILRSGDEGFAASAGDVQVLLPDLSKYGLMMEVFGIALVDSGSSSSQQSGLIRLEESSSSVDPGEGHEKVKSLNDLVFLSDVGSTRVEPTIQLGLRVEVVRGGPLDVGLYPCAGGETCRGKLTIELYVARGPLVDGVHDTADAASDKYFCLLRRVAHKPISISQLGLEESEESTGTVFWGVWLDSRGTIHCGVDPRQSSNVIRSEPGTVKLSTEYVVWSHVVVILDSSNDSGYTSAALLVNGVRVARGDITLPALSSTGTATYASEGSTWLQVGPNLQQGLFVWRMTELRFWVEVRSVEDLEAQAYNYLPLAAKRKRLQFRIKGSTKLFGPPPSSLSLLKGAAPDANVSDIISHQHSFDASANAFSSFASTPGESRGRPNSLQLPVGGSPFLSTPGTAPTQHRASTLPLPSPGSGPGPSGLSNAAARRRQLAQPSVPLAAPPSVPLAAPPPIPVVDPWPETTPMSSVVQSTKPKACWQPAINAADWSFYSDPCALLPSDVSRCLRRRLIASFSSGSVQAHSASFAVCRKGSTESEVFVVSVPLDGSTAESVWRLPVSVDSALAAPIVSDIGSSKPPPVALLLRNPARLSIWAWGAPAAHSTGSDVNGRTIAEMPMSVPLVFWSFFSSPDPYSSPSLLLVTPTTAFRWNPLAGPGRNRPIKLFNRTDVTDPQRWMDRRVLGLQLTLADPGASTGLAMMSSVGRVSGGSEPSLVTMHHMTSDTESSLVGLESFEADAGCFNSRVGALKTSETPVWLVKEENGNTVIAMVTCMFPVGGETETETPHVRRRLIDMDVLPSGSAKDSCSCIWRQYVAASSVGPGHEPQAAGALCTLLGSAGSERLLVIAPTGFVFLFSAATGTPLNTSSVVLRTPEPILCAEVSVLSGSGSRSEGGALLLVVGAQSGRISQLRLDELCDK